MSELVKAYLGDAVYAQVVDERIVLTTEDGFCATNTIVLEPEVWLALKEFVEPVIVKVTQE